MQFPVEAPRRIVKKRGGHGGHHGGAWKVAYADFVTAMMALFIVLWIVGQSKDVKNSVAAYFKDPSAFQKGSSKLLKGGEGPGASLPAIPVPGPPPSESGKGQERGDREALEAAATSLREQIHQEAH